MPTCFFAVLFVEVFGPQKNDTQFFGVSTVAEREKHSAIADTCLERERERGGWGGRERRGEGREKEAIKWRCSRKVCGINRSLSIDTRTPHILLYKQLVYCLFHITQCSVTHSLISFTLSHTSLSLSLTHP